MRAYACISGLEKRGVVTVNNTASKSYQRSHEFPFQLTQRTVTGEWRLPRQWGDGPATERFADFDADLRALGFRRAGEWVSDAENRWASGWETTVERLS